jgi:hypothetical protein
MIQGVVYETIQMSRVPDFAVGGTIHVIVNNQVGFTTDPKNARSTMYSSDLGKAFNIPIFHCTHTYTNTYYLIHTHIHTHTHTQTHIHTQARHSTSPSSTATGTTL